MEGQADGLPLLLCIFFIETNIKYRLSVGENRLKYYFCKQK